MAKKLETVEAAYRALIKARSFEVLHPANKVGLELQMKGVKELVECIRADEAELEKERADLAAKLAAFDKALTVWSAEHSLDGAVAPVEEALGRN